MGRRRKRPVYAGRGGIHREGKSILFGGARRRRRRRWVVGGAALAAGSAGAAVAVAREADRPYGLPVVTEPEIEWRKSRAIGRWYDGRLVRGVELPHEGADFFTWDPILKRRPNRGWRRHGTDRLVRLVLEVAEAYRLDNPDAPRLGIGDLSRPRGGEFGRRFGGLGHLSHQNGLDVDVYYPRRDRRERRPHAPRLVDRRLAQNLVDRFVDAGAVKVFVGPRLGLRGPRRVVVPLVHHDDHLHVRIR